jgi:hypothetical protein
LHQSDKIFDFEIKMLLIDAIKRKVKRKFNVKFSKLDRETISFSSINECRIEIGGAQLLFIG